MASWYKDLLTNASTNITKLQRTYLKTETDGDTEDDTHVCNVLRAYYTEKGQAFPGWLPPDPKAPPPVQPVYASQNQVGSRYGGLNNNAQQGGRGAGNLSSLWDNNNNNQGGGQPASLRQGRQNPFVDRSGSAPGMRGGREEAQSRPLPSQRAGSYQQQQPQGGSYGQNDGRSSTGSGGSAQDKLKQRLWGGARTTSPGGGGGPFQPPAQQQSQSSSRWGSGNSGGGSGNYEDRFAPSGAYGGGNDQPVMSANAPWAGGDMDYYSGGNDYSSSGGGGGGGSGGRRPVGLPSGPRKGGLPSGPRMR